MRFMMRVSSLSAILLSVFSGAALFWVSQQVQQVEREQRQLLMSNLQQEESIRVLQAEWDYLNRPERLEELANKYLNMSPVSAERLIQSISAIPEPEAPSLAPEEQALEVSVSSPEKKEASPSLTKLPPPVLDQNEVSQEAEFEKVLDSTEAKTP